MSATAAFGEQLDALGIWWPRGDGDALRSAAGAWETIADYLEDTHATLDQATRRVLDDHRGESAEAFAACWSEWSGPDGYLGRTAGDCRRLCLALVDFASDIDAADRTIVQLIELALTSVTAAGAGGATLLDLDEAWRRWLDEAIGAVGGGLAAGAERTAALARSVEAGSAPSSPDAGGATGTPATPVGDVATDPDAPNGGATTVAPRIDLDLLDPDQIDWVHPGTPEDLSHLVTDVVDLGAGQGVVPAVGAPAPAPWPPVSSPDWPNGTPPGWPIDPTTGLPLPWPGSPSWPSIPGSPGWPGSEPSDGTVTITVNGDGAVVNVGDNNQVTVSAPPTSSSGMPVVPAPVPPMTPLVPDLGPTDLESVPPPISAGGSGGGFGGGGSIPALSGGSVDLSGIDGPITPGEPFELTDLTGDAFVAQLDTPAAVATATPDAVGPVPSSSGSGRMPFFPMMPMGAGGSGDDGQEPRRKRMRP